LNRPWYRCPYPTLLLTNQLTRSASHLIGRYAQRMLIENNIEDGIDFFHMDALSSAVAMKTNCDLQLTLMASSLYRLLAARVGNGYETAKSRHLFRHFVDASASVMITEGDVVVRFRSVPTIPCWSPPSSTRRMWPSPGWGPSASSSSSGSLGLPDTQVPRGGHSGYARSA